MSDSLKKLRILLFNPKISKETVLAFVKTEMNPGEFEAAINSNPLLKKAKLTNTRFSDISSIVQKDAIVFTNDIRKELFWLLYNIKEEAEFINAFLIEKSQFERFFLLGQYNEAENVLGKIRGSFGETIWALEMSLLLKEYQFGSKENWACLSEYLKKINSPFYQFVLNAYSKRIEENMSFENFYNQFQIDIDSTMTESLVRDFLVFKSVFNAGYDYAYSNLEGALYVANILGVIDQYLTLIEGLLKIFAVGSQNDKAIIGFLKKLEDKISNDNKLINLKNALGIQKNTVVLNSTSFVLPIIDEYTKSNFESAKKLSAEKLYIYPEIFELHEIYCKCLINLNQQFEPLKISPVIDEVLESVYRVLLFNIDSEKHRNRLLKLSLTFLTFDFGKQISSFALSVSRDYYSNFHSIVGYLSSSINNPRLFSLNLDDRNKLHLANHESLPTSEAFRVNMFISVEVGADIAGIVKNVFQSDVYLAKHLSNKGDYSLVIDTLEKYIDNFAIPFYYDNLLFLLFEAYLKTDSLIKALQLNSAILSDKDFFLYRLNTIELSIKIKQKGFDHFSEYIDLPILFSIVVKDYDLYEPYIEFMLFNETEYPSKLNIQELTSKFSLNKVVYFLREVCKISTIKYSLVYTSIEKAEQERIQICEILKNLDATNLNVYENEISELLRIDAVRKVIKEVDEGRLFVNVEGLKNQQLLNLNESFTRYKEIESISKEKGLIGFNSSKERNWISINLQQKQLYSELDDPAFLAFKTIFMESKERFLFSKEYGLDSSLSTRIRHGALKNHIRSVFEKLSLITSKSGNEYVDNYKWHEQLIYDYDLNLQVQRLLKSFSKKIDDYTTYIVEKLIQIQTERHVENQDGLFQYYTDDAILWVFYQEYKNSFDSVDSVIDTVYNYLTNYTIRTVCADVYDYFINDINEKYQELIEELQMQLRELDLVNKSELLPSVLKCSTDIQGELEVIAEWFTLTTTGSSSLLDIETIINASIELTNQINPNFCLSPKILNNCEPVIGFNALIFVFNILLNNIIQHSKLEPHEIEVEIALEQRENYIIINFKNNLSTEASFEKNKERLESVKKNWNNHTDIERSNKEGESGYDKIKRLLLYEAKAKTDKFDYLFDSDKITISLYFPYNKPDADEQGISN